MGRIGPICTVDAMVLGHTYNHVDTSRVVFRKAGCWSRCRTNVVLCHIMGAPALWWRSFHPCDLLVRTESNLAISRGYMFSYEIKIIEIGPVFGAGELSHGFSPHRMKSEVEFLISLENEELWGEATIDEISKGRKL
ncbi:hypothetical protein AVEN_101525-1 [Araneus ventricosus]|uniref:Uncharacterized protein n=1 Tax=Araneus ventricosus TaxID=182803 RepID=A0A4Y2GR81_ARAVE|nr:hypothetical protein AVEN_101525-1 [Araneus ventricosus]